MKRYRLKMLALLLVVALLVPMGASVAVADGVKGVLSIQFLKDEEVVTDAGPFSCTLNGGDVTYESFPADEDQTIIITLSDDSLYRFEVGTEQDVSTEVVVKAADWFDEEYPKQTVKVQLVDKIAEEEPDPEPETGKLTVVFHADGKPVSPAWKRVFLDGTDTNSLVFPDVLTEVDHKVSVHLKAGTDYRFKGTQPEPNSAGIVIKEFTVSKDNWARTDGALTQTLIVELEEIPRIWFTYAFPKNGGADLYVDGDKMPVGGKLLEKGKQYELTATKAGAKLIADPLKEADNGYLLEKDGKFYLDATKTGESARVYLAFQKDIGTYFTESQSVVGKAEVAIKLKDTADKLGIAKLFAVYKGKLSSDKEIVQLIDNVVVVLLPENLENLGDKVEIFALMKDGTYSQVTDVVAGYQAMEITVDEFFAGDKVLKGKADPGAEVVITRGTKELVKVKANAEGVFEAALKTPLEKDEVFTIYSKSDTKRSLDLTLTVVNVKDVAPEKTTKRISGLNRYLTAVEISKESFENKEALKSKTVILAYGLKEADALAAGPLSITLGAPILLVDKENIPAAVLQELKRLAPEKVIIVGGESSVSKTVAEVVAALDIRVTRLAGLNRYETSLKVAEHLKDNHNVKDIILANGLNSVDALAVSAYAAKKDLAIVLTAADVLPASIRTYIENDPAIKVGIVGGPNSVSKGIEEGLGKVFSERIEGQTRFETAEKLAKLTFEEPTAVTFVNGEQGKQVDALAATLYAYQEGMPILLIQKTQIPKVVKDYVEAEKIDNLVVIGGVDSISNTVMDDFLKINPLPEK